MLLAYVLMLIFLVIANIDGLYYHMWLYRLYARPESRREHFLHTANVCLFLPQAFLMFCVRPYGLWLTGTVLLALVTLGVEIADVLSERDSRRNLGGLVPLEYLMHFLMSGLRGGYCAAFLASIELGDFAAPAELARAAYPWVGWFVVVPGFTVAALHIALCSPRRIQAGLPAVRSAS